MVRISLFKRYQGSEKEDQVLKNQIKTLDIPEGFNIRWLKSVDYTNGFSEMKSLPSTDSDLDKVIEDSAITADDSLSFKKHFKAMFPDRSASLKMLALTKDDGKVIASGLLLI